MGEALCHCFHKCKEVLEIVWSLYNKVISFGFSNGNCACIAHFYQHIILIACLYWTNMHEWLTHLFYPGLSTVSVFILALARLYSLIFSLFTTTLYSWQAHVKVTIFLLVLGSFTLASSMFMNWRFYLLFLSL